MAVYAAEAAAKFNMSASTLRNYEAKGLIPPAARLANGYRVYTARHEGYLACIQAMSVAFGMEITASVLRHLQLGEWESAMWIVREEEVRLHEVRTQLAAVLRELTSYADGSFALDRTRDCTIQDVSHRTGAPKSAIRYWEKEGYLTVARDSSNRYRLYGEADLYMIRLIQVLQSCVYSEETVALKQTLKLIDPYQIGEAAAFARQLSALVNKTLMAQMRAISRLSRLIDMEQGHPSGAH